MVPEVSSFLVVGVVDCLGGRTCLNVRARVRVAVVRIGDVPAVQVGEDARVQWLALHLGYGGVHVEQVLPGQSVGVLDVGGRILPSLDRRAQIASKVLLGSAVL